MAEHTRAQIRNEFRSKLDYAIRRADYEAFKEILTLAEIVPGSERYRSLEALFWSAVAEHRKSKHESP